MRRYRSADVMAHVPGKIALARALFEGLVPFRRRMTSSFERGVRARPRPGLRLTSQRGQGMVEYAFILVLISLVVIVMLITTGGQIRSLFSDITFTLNNTAGL
jgi:Flp pilus assembly pilin Flp